MSPSQSFYQSCLIPLLTLLAMLSRSYFCISDACEVLLLVHGSTKARLPAHIVNRICGQTVCCSLHSCRFAVMSGMSLSRSFALSFPKFNVRP
ncbi:hypothetical protein K431DRAFT_64641 [Polychaeton citri CBS 116435]|uniref:Secreted protein n=1 Tax=Polychaeton citri CBS 116435 TaxID=1314669 RepID=A0A9P4UQI0_9PEZI|nr:hypothetical protein K431DRAFT_64641 [Polychaeton citri CBS 116435]